MKKKDILFFCAIANGALLCALFIVGVMTPEKKVLLVDALDKTKPAMLQVEPIVADNTENHPLEIKEKIVYQLPKIQKEKPIEKVENEKVVIVEKRDTLEAIARKEKTTVEAIIALNDLKSPLLKIGQALKIPHAEKSQIAKKEKNATEKKAIKAENIAEKYYTVKVGDNPWTIAMKHHMKVKTLLELNTLDDKSARKIKPGDKLRVR